MAEPKIAERVKFWQEQDRINRELIPRVIKNHELLTKHVESHGDGDSMARTQIEALEGRMVDGDETASRELAAARAQIGALEARVAEIETHSADNLMQWVPYAGLALAIVALALALVR